MRHTKYFVLGMTVTPLALVAIGVAIASSVSTPNTFSAGTTAVAAEVNANFTAHSDAINDNDARITALENALGLVNQAEALRIIRGSLNADGTIFSGAGFTVDKTGTGTYSIMFDAPFSDVPVIVHKQFEGAGFVVNNAMAEAGFVDVFVQLDGVDADGGFDFVAIGLP